jgi:hypothetical protein
MDYTYDELKQLCDEFFNNLSDDARYQFIKQNDCTFEQYVLSKIKKGDKVHIDYDSCEYIII